MDLWLAKRETGWYYYRMTKRLTLKEKVYRRILSAGDSGLTISELVSVLNRQTIKYPRHSVRARVSELKQKGLLNSQSGWFPDRARRSCCDSLYTVNDTQT